MILSPEGWGFITLPKYLWAFTILTRYSSYLYKCPMSLWFLLFLCPSAIILSLRLWSCNDIHVGWSLFHMEPKSIGTFVWTQESTYPELIVSFSGQCYLMYCTASSTMGYDSRRLPSPMYKQLGHSGQSWVYKTGKLAVCTEQPYRYSNTTTSGKGQSWDNLDNLATLLIPLGATTIYMRKM